MRGTLCNKFLPASLHAKIRDRVTAQSKTNPVLWQYMWAFAARHNLEEDEKNHLWAALGKIVQESKSP